MSIDTLFVDPSRCIGCRACEAACRECDSHKGESMIMVDFIDRTYSVATQPTVCMHCEDPVAPCAQVCPVMAILITPEGVVQQADASRCIAMPELCLCMSLRRAENRPFRAVNEEMQSLLRPHFPRTTALVRPGMSNRCLVVWHL